MPCGPHASWVSGWSTLIDLIELSADAGLVAIGAATVNLWLGLLIASRYSPVKYWPHRKMNIFFFHRLTAYLTLGLTFLHPIILLFATRVHFRVLDILVPLWSPLQPIENTLGAISAYLLIIVVLTSIYRLKLGRKLWRLTHWLVYPAAVLLFIHGILTDSELRTGKPDLLDAEKVYVMICLVLCIVATWLSVSVRRKRHHASVTQTVGA